jgi:glycosyltransferase involved in cell wall biosynthesis
MYNLAKRLVSRGHRVTILTTNLIGGSVSNLLPEEYVDGIRVLRLPVLPSKLWRRLVIAPSVTSKLLFSNAEIIHVFSILPYFLTDVACIMAKLGKRHLFVTPTYHPVRYAIYRGFVSHLRRSLYDDFVMLNLLRSADCVIALTEKEAQYYKKMGIGNVQVIPIGVDIYQQSNISDIENLKKKFGLKGKVILHVGRLEKRKGVQYAIQAMPLILKEIADVKLLLVGSDAGYQNRLRELATNLSVEDSLVFAGSLSSSELAAAYSLADVVVIPSVYEAFSHIAIEAMAFRKPVIMSKTVGFAERINANSGVLIDLGDFQALSKAALELLSNQNLARSMGIEGRRIVESDFTWERVVDKLERLYCSIARRSA